MKVKEEAMNVKYGLFVFATVLGISLIANTTYVNAYGPSIGYYWPSAYLYPLNYYDTSGYSEVSSTVTDYNNAAIPVGDFYRVYTPDGTRLTIVSYSLEDDGWGYWSASHSGTSLTAFCVHLNSYEMNQGGVTANSRRNAIAHELGHCWSLGHETNEQEQAIMYPTHESFSWWGIYMPQSDDIEGINYYY